ncbi:hypothetical protein M0R45_029554 [Rubus argutus]|uniref:Alpha-carbonic anhydrase domain-containing protein n=1 Tax=Rubus argutus TaxID=59490 RepID=A0AAW1W8U3_RUBAR
MRIVGKPASQLTETDGVHCHVAVHLNGVHRRSPHDIKVGWEGDAGSIEINGIQYLLQQAHWHSPSEHSINGKRYDMELHMTYASPDLKVQNNIVVVAVLYKIGPPDAFLSKLMKDVALMTNKKAERSIGVIDPSELIKLGVIWIISKQIRTVSKEQINLLRVAVHDYADLNARPVQSLNLFQEIQVSDNSARDKHN